MAVQRYPIVLVPGMSGWGTTSKLNQLLPYWGFARFDIAAILNSRGYETYVASMAPLGSAWDRMCELYAQMTGTRVDYGKAHSERFGHARYGRTYSEPLVPGWGETDDNGDVRKVNLVAHSFGGVSARMMSQFLAEGCAEEIEATTDGSLSPLFAGGQSGRIFSITTFCSPHNGTDLQTAMPLPISRVVQAGYYGVNYVSANTPLQKWFDIQLEHFGVGADDSSRLGWKEYSFFMHCGDNVFYDVGVDGSARINRRLHTQDDVYYFSFAFCGTKENRFGSQSPMLDKMIKPMLFFGQCLGAHTETTKDGAVIDTSWEKNDGVVNTISALSPSTEPSKAFDPEDIPKGVWNVMPVRTGDHATPVGWGRRREETMPLYCKHFKQIDKLTAAEQTAKMKG